MNKYAVNPLAKVCSCRLSDRAGNEHGTVFVQYRRLLLTDKAEKLAGYRDLVVAVELVDQHSVTQLRKDRL